MPPSMLDRASRVRFVGSFQRGRGDWPIGREVRYLDTFDGIVGNLQGAPPSMDYARTLLVLGFFTGLG